LIGFDVESLTDPDIRDSNVISVRELGTLKAGEEKAMTFTTGVLFPLRNANGNPWKDKQEPLQLRFMVMPVIWQLFSGGVEVKAEVAKITRSFTLLASSWCTG